MPDLVILDMAEGDGVEVFDFCAEVAVELLQYLCAVEPVVINRMVR